jgi:hypothetical protein
MRLKEVPKLTWGMQRTGVEKLTAGDVARLVQVASITPAQSQVLLRKMGVPLEDVPNDPDVGGNMKQPQPGPFGRMKQKVLEAMGRKQAEDDSNARMKVTLLKALENRMGMRDAATD